MEQTEKLHYQTVSIKSAVFCATIGLFISISLIALAFLLGGGFNQLMTDGINPFIRFLREFRYFKEVIATISALYLSAIVLGKYAGSIISRIGIENPRMPLLGIGLALSCLICSALALTSVNFFIELYRGVNLAHTFESYVFKPLFWIIFVGFFPALILGIIYVQRVKKQIIGNRSLVLLA